MLRIYHSNSLDTLRDVLVELIKRDPNPDPFVAETILVQSPGMAQWLKLELAERMGIAANVDFPLPASFLWQMFKNVLPNVPERSSYSKSTLTWVLMRILPQTLDDVDFAVLKTYLDQDNNPLRLYRLCGKIADLFDQYLVYRPDWIKDWEAGEDQPASSDNLWQPRLWRLIVADMAQRNLPHWHRANMFDTLVTGLNQYRADDLPPRVFIFGISALAENYLQAIEALAGKIEVHLMIANPCQHYWGDIVDSNYLMKLSRQWLVKQQPDQSELFAVGHPLLASMGKLGRDYLYLVQQRQAPEVLLFNEPVYDSILHAVQSDILTLNDASQVPAEQRLNFPATDRSLQLHKAHSPMREVEILHDQLLAMFEADPELKPRDIIVMLPGVADYVPYIDAVFANQSAEQRLPYAISDRTVGAELPLISSFIQLLNLNTSRFSVSEILPLLELPATLRRFDIQPEQLEDIRAWLVKTGINWGLDDAFRHDLGTANFAENSWAFGFDRLFAGYALGETDTLWHGISAYAGVTGLQADLLGRLYDFIAELKQLRAELSEAKTCAHWLQRLNGLIEDFYAPDDLDHEAIALIHKALEEWQATLNEASFDQLIAADIVQDYCNNTLAQQSSAPRFLSGQINFCTLMPMRSIPFKVVCLLGMNDGAYPRSITPMGFDLMEKFSRRGDRSRRDDDRYLFLEAILSAKQQLYISYVARSIRDNSECIPSVLVSELFEYCEAAYRIAEAPSLLQHISTEHPLTPYSHAYYDPSSRLFSYKSNWLLGADTSLKQDITNAEHSFVQSLPPVEIKQLELAELVRFFAHPIRAFFHQRLQVYLRDDYSRLQDDEPFSLNGLDDYQLRKTLLTTAMKGQPLQPLQDKMQRGGQLPVGIVGQSWINRRVQDVTELVEKLQPDLAGEVDSVELRLQLGGVELLGWINHLYPAGAVSYDAVKVRGQHHFSLWIQHLALCAMGYSRSSIYRGLSGKIRYKPVPQEIAETQLVALIGLYKQGMQIPIPWLAEPAWAWLSLREDNESKALVEAQKRFEQSLSGDFIDPYVQRVYPEWSMVEKGIPDWTEALFSPLMDYLDNDS